jgi:hypothetical protein
MFRDNRPRRRRPTRTGGALLIGTAMAFGIAVAAGSCVRADDGQDAARTGATVKMVPSVEVPPVRGGIDVEQVYYAQYRLLREAMDALAPGRPGVPDLFFVGFAGDATQDVFLREVGSVRDLFDNRFDTRGRSLLLINNPATVGSAPLANTHNLLAALDTVGARMDRDEDALFLFLTSHGTPGVLSVEFEPLKLNALTARRLRELLDRSGIKWRIIVVSACYSGSFINTLKNDNTMIVTAARHDRVSFGCAHENDFTYFGRAYFDKALRRTHSFSGAYDTARKTVGRWEAEEDLEPSLPQIYIGDAIRPKLAEIEARLRELSPAH